eukprot:5646428-Pleurochrysis_carterae.AAC.1
MVWYGNNYFFISSYTTPRTNMQTAVKRMLDFRSRDDVIFGTVGRLVPCLLRCPQLSMAESVGGASC